MLLKPGAITQGGKRLSTPPTDFVVQESSTQESCGALAPRPQATKGPSSRGKEHYLHTRAGGGGHLKEVPLPGPF